MEAEVQHRVPEWPTQGAGHKRLKSPKRSGVQTYLLTATWRLLEEGRVP